MASCAITLTQIRDGRVLERVVVRLVRFWVVRNVRGGGEVRAMDLLLVDEESTVAHATINVAFVPKFQSFLRDGAVYILSNFDAGRIGSRSRLSDFRFSLRFNDSTSMTAIAGPFPQIPEQVFRFRSLAELEALAFFNTDLPDIIGQIISIRIFRDGITEELIKVLVVLQLQSGQQVRLIASDGQASLLENLLNSRNSDFCVLLATNISPGIFAGKLHVNATVGTRFFFYGELDVTRDFMDSVEPINLLAKYRSVQLIEHVSIADLNYFILTAKPQDIEYICSAKVIGIQGRRGWSFISCTECGRKMQMMEPSFSCNMCSGPISGGDVKYRVELVVDDGSSKAVFVVYDAEMEKITGIQASELTLQATDVRVGGDVGKIPSIITDLIGSTFTFYLRLTEFNFSSYHESFTVSRVCRPAKAKQKPSVSEKDQRVATNALLGDADDGAAVGTSDGLVLSTEKNEHKLL